MDFAQRFELLCKQEKETPTSLGTQLGFSKGAISKWRNGKCAPRGKSLQRLADHFGVSVDYLLGKSDIRNADSEFEDMEKAKVLLFGTDDVPEKAWYDVKKFVAFTKRKYQLK